MGVLVYEMFLLVPKVEEGFITEKKKRNREFEVL